MTKENFSVRKIVLCGVLIALNIIFARFLSIQAWSFRIGFTFLSYATAAILYGPLEGAIVGGVGDLLGATVFATTGAYFPGFTITAILEGAVFGIFLKKKVSLPRVLGAVAIEQFILSLLMNSYWISVLYGKGFWALLPTRAAQAILLFVVETVVLMLLERSLFPMLRRRIAGNE